MKKVFKTRNLQNQRVVACIEIHNGYLSITGEVYEYRHREPSIFGCCHEYIADVFPKLRKIIPFHLWDVEKCEPGFYPFRNSLFTLIRGEGGREYLKNELHTTDDEATQIMSLVEYGLTPKHDRLIGKTYDDENIRVYKNFIYKLGIPDRWKSEMKEVLEYIDTL